MTVTGAPLTRRNVLALGAAALMAAKTPALAGRARPVTELSGSAFGTGWRVVLKDEPKAGLERRLAGTLCSVDRAFSPWRGDSTITRFNRGTAREATVSAEVADVVRLALHIAGASGGRFDPTVGPMVARWGFGPIEGEVLADGWREIAAGNGHVARAVPGLTLDLCGIAKGHALDRMTADLLDAGHEDFLADIGGELAARGRHPSGRAWTVGIENPLAGESGVAGLARLDGMAIATSGDRANGYDLGGRRYSHIIDPSTREPVEGALASISVAMPLAAEADGWATALMAAGADGPALARRHAIAALFLFREGSGLRQEITGVFDRLLV